jgi:molecular chaperone HtpG
LPKWAFFVRGIFNTNTLQPTASRESFYEDDHLEKVSAEIGEAIRKHLFYLSKNEPTRLRYILDVHSIALKAMALEDDDFFNIMIPWFKFSTTSGDLTIRELDKKQIIHVPNIDRFRQIAPVAIAQQQTIINSGFIHDAELLRKLGYINEDYKIEEIDSNNFIDIFEDITVDERNQTFDFQQEANDILKKRECKIKIKRFAPASLPAIYYSSKNSFDIHLSQSKEVADDMWSGMLGGMKTEVKYSTLCLNIDNELVQTLIQLEKSVLKSMLEILYVNAMLMGHYPLNKNEISILNNNLLDILKIKLNK